MEKIIGIEIISIVNIYNMKLQIITHENLNAQCMRSQFCLFLRNIYLWKAQSRNISFYYDLNLNFQYIVVLTVTVS